MKAVVVTLDGKTVVFAHAPRPATRTHTRVAPKPSLGFATSAS
jgi:hypothetical protein